MSMLLTKWMLSNICIHVSGKSVVLDRDEASCRKLSKSVFSPHFQARCRKGVGRLIWFELLFGVEDRNPSRLANNGFVIGTFSRSEAKIPTTLQI